MKSKKISFVFAAVFLFLNTFAQEVTPLKVREVGIGLYNFQNFSLQYRWGNEKRLFRITGNLGLNTMEGTTERNGSRLEDSLNYNYYTFENANSPVNLSVGLGFSILKLKPINDKFGFMYGPLAGLTYTYMHSKRTSGSAYTGASSSGVTEQKSQTIQPYIGIVIGAAYKINASFFIYAEIGPNFYYAFSQSSSSGNSTSSSSYYSEEEGSTKSNSFGISNLSNSGAMLTFVYRFNKK